MKNKVEIESIQRLREYLEKNKSLTFSSKPKKLSHLRILLFALATRDFNPAHIISSFADKSIFKSIVSHGIGTAGRAEATYVQMVCFTEPSELIAKGYDSIRYYKPLRLGDTYQYEYSLSNLEFKKNLWNLDCSIVCKTTAPETQEVAKCIWKICYVENPSLSTEERKMLLPKNYYWNVLKYFIFEPIMIIMCAVVGGGGTLIGLILLILQLCGVIPAVDNSATGCAL